MVHLRISFSFITSVCTQFPRTMHANGIWKKNITKNHGQPQKPFYKAVECPFGSASTFRNSSSSSPSGYDDGDFSSFLTFVDLISFDDLFQPKPKWRLNDSGSHIYYIGVCVWTTILHRHPSWAVIDTHNVEPLKKPTPFSLCHTATSYHTWLVGLNLI